MAWRPSSLWDLNSPPNKNHQTSQQTYQVTVIAIITAIMLDLYIFLWTPLCSTSVELPVFTPLHVKRPKKYKSKAEIFLSTAANVPQFEVFSHPSAEDQLHAALCCMMWCCCRSRVGSGCCAAAFPAAFWPFRSQHRWTRPACSNTGTLKLWRTCQGLMVHWADWSVSR